MKPTEEQQAIIDYALTGDNLIVQAYAGYGYWSEFCDSVICNMCGKHGYVEQGAEKCPACGEIGYLMDMEDLPHDAD